MKKFKRVLYTINRSLGCMIFGATFGSILNGYLKTALVLSLITTVMFGVGYFTEYESKY